MVLLRKDRIWPTLIVTALLGNVALGMVLIRVAKGDEHFAVEPDYYRKAVTWDATMAQARRNSALGWQLTPRLGAIQPGQDATLVLDVRDAAGVAVSDAVVTLEAMPVAYAGEVLRATLRPAGEAGRYGAAMAIARTGLWELRVDVVRGTERFTGNLRLEASAAGEATVITERPGDARP
jgi:nitrogen fixation protein FixH